MKCCIESCGNTGKGKKSASITERITYHTFPKDLEKRELWLKSLGIPNLPTSRTLVCSDHFNEEDFIVTQNGIRKIKVGRVPCVKDNVYGPAALKTCKLCLSLNTKMYKIKDHGLDKMYQDIMGIPPSTDHLNRLPMGICWECTARLQSASAFRSKALFSDALLQDHLKTNADLTIIDIQNIHGQQINLKSGLAIQEVFRFNSHNGEEYAPNTFIKAEVIGIPNNEEIEVDVQHLVTERITIKDERKNEDIIENFPDTDFKTEIDLIPNNEIEFVEDETFLDDDAFSDNDNVETVLENDFVEKSRKDVDKVFWKEKREREEMEKINFAAKLTEIIETNDDELMDLAMTSEDDDDEDEFQCVKNKGEKVRKEAKKLKKKAKIVDDEVIIGVKKTRQKRTRAKKKQPYVKPCLPIDENIFTMKMLTDEDLKQEMLARRKSKNYIKARFKCKVCYKGFKTVESQERHMIKHSEQSGPLKCNICYVRVKTARKLRAHMNNQHTKEFICKLCPFVTKNRNVALGHIKYHAGNKYKCPQCSVEFEKRTTLQNHLRLYHMSSCVCELCGYTFVGKKGVEVHKQKWHKFFDAKTVFEGPHCDVCDVKFLTDEAYNRHLRLSSNHITEDDPNRISNKPSLKYQRIDSVRRRVIHRKDENAPVTTGSVTCELTVFEGPHCDVCDVKFLTDEAYNRHLRLSSNHITEDDPNRISNDSSIKDQRIDSVRRRVIHRKDENAPVTTGSVSCELCGVELESLRVYTNHFRYAHPGEKRTQFAVTTSAGATPYMCEHCGKFFINKTTLSGHMWVHTGQKLFQCDLCNKSFSMKGTLAYHIKQHDGTQQYYECQVCGKQFTFIGNLTRHMNVHTGLRPFKCDACEKTFQTLPELRAHFDHVHLKKPRPKRIRRKANKFDMPTLDV